jgi:glycine/D-amino acid oxidase-like deaminating enzyme
MLGGYERDPRIVDTRQRPADFRVEDLELDLSVLQRLAASVHEQFPVFRDAALQEHRGGLPTMTLDGEHVVGPAPGIEGLYVMGGCNVGGLSISPALGEELANWIIDGRPTVDLRRMSPSRFAENLSEDELVRGTTFRYANYYTPSVPMP